MKRPLRLAAVLAALATRIAITGVAGFLVHCAENPTQVTQGGGGSEAVALTGTVRNPDQTPALSARVRVRPRLFLQDPSQGAVPDPGLTVADTVTNDSGAFRLDSLAPGEYHLEIRDALGRGILVPFAVTGLAPRVELASAVLKPTGQVTGAFLAPAGFAGRTWVQVYGMERLVLADSGTGRFTLDSMPEGTFTLRALHTAPAVNPLDVGAVPSKPSLSTDIGAFQLGSFELENYGNWPMYMRININTTPAGADVPGLVTDFPLLVRLTARNFDFSQARGDGGDIRFSDSRGKRLRYQVERWDSAGARAEIWVRADAIQGNSRDQFITLHWGNPAAMDWSDGRAVFERDYGFAGVWHLDEEAAGTGVEDLYADAVGINFGDDAVSSADKAGLAGRGAAFDGNDAIMVPVADPVLKPTGRVFASAWVRADTTGPQGGNILSMGDNYNLRVTLQGRARFSLFDGAARFVEEPQPTVRDGRWHHVAGLFDGKAIVLYVDGVERARAATTAPISYNKSPNFVVGRHGDGKSGYEFIGNLDEITVASEVRSPEWIKLVFESQREGSKLLEFVP